MARGDLLLFFSGFLDFKSSFDLIDYSSAKLAPSNHPVSSERLAFLRAFSGLLLSYFEVDHRVSHGSWKLCNRPCPCLNPIAVTGGPFAILTLGFHF
jgi:hypothetical protein